MPISQRQQRYLEDRLSSIRSTKPSRWQDVELPDTAAVKKARAAVEASNVILEAHEEKKKKLSKERKEAIEKTYSDCRRQIMFGEDSDKALKALDAFEAKEF